MHESSLIVERPYRGVQLPFGISGIIRLKNAACCVETVIESFIPFLDEIVAVYADCDDDTPYILERLKQRYPEKLRVYAYPSHVASIFSKEHMEVGRLSPKSIANYYNWAFSKASYSVVTKIDHDHLPMEPAFAEAVSMIRRVKPKHFLYTYSGLNLTKTKQGKFGVPLDQVFVGVGDHWFFDLGEDVYFEHLPLYEDLVFDKARRRKHLGLLYWHVKRLLPGYRPQVPAAASKAPTAREIEGVEWEAFKKAAKRRFFFWGHPVSDSKRRVFEGRAHWLVRLLLLLPNLKKMRSRLIYINVRQLRMLDKLPQEIQSGKLASAARSGGEADTDSSSTR